MLIVPMSIMPSLVASLPFFFPERIRRIRKLFSCRLRTGSCCEIYGNRPELHPLGKDQMRTAFTVLAVLSLSFALRAADPFDGTWKLNVAKSKLQCSDVASRTMKITSTAPNSQDIVSDIVSKSGVHQERK